MRMTQAIGPPTILGTDRHWPPDHEEDYGKN